MSLPAPPSHQRPEGGGSGPNPDPPVKKRKRTAQACGQCRTKKTKCDGIHPACTPCISLGYECSYPLDSSAPPSGSVVVSKDYLAALERRLHRLESGQERAPAPSNTYMSPPSNVRQASTPRTASSTDEHQRRNYTNNGAGLPHRDHSGHEGDAYRPIGSSPRTYRPFDVTQPAAPRERSTSLSGAAFQMHAAVARPEPASSAVLSPNTTVDGPAIDGMGLLLGPERIPRNSEQGGLDWGGSPEGEVFGDLSGISFHRLLLDTLLPGYWCMGPMDDMAVAGADQHGGGSGGEDAFLGVPALHDMFYIRPDDLPPREQAHAMIDYFEAHTWQIYPVVDAASLHKTYEQLHDDVAEYARQLLAGNPGHMSDPLRVSRNQPIIALHFIVFAFCQSLSGTPFTSIDVHKLALRMLRKHLDWPHSTFKVQVLLIAALHMQGMDRPGTSWDLLGYAVGSAYAVGLHDKGTNERFPPMEREMRSRVWWACYTFDRLLAVSIGRPSLISFDAFSAPMPSMLPGEPEMAVRFMGDSIRLYQGLSDVISNPPISFRNASPEFVSSVTEQMYQLEKQYAAWSEAVTPELNFTNHPPTSALSTVLALRGLTLRLLLHRRVMLAGLREHIGPRSRSSTPISAMTSIQYVESRQRHHAFGMSLALVIETAIQTAQVLEGRTDEPLVLSAPWYLLFYSMNAFMSLVAAFLLDLTQWAWFIRTPAATIVHALLSVHVTVRQIYERYNRPNARRALLIIEHILNTLGLSTSAEQNTTPTAPEPTSLDGIEAVASLMASFQDLPHLDLVELSKTLGIELEAAASA
ncbi:hypothetical protein CspeluHIS016_0100620 [Cutaneotrichosporon spelunceum]|uniref:Zn(2)-C6 fungal-type domain-containing protein n=1 Tax=Cutaneotrichosporon spelunceum TaxID=1672016 RepID=A0AAD3TNC2_9TREE|nr:hypothetical protein CspeluHIS016_0100620 [Cutaneotrichosporon spelunceum]